MENQTKMIKAHLDQGNSITALEALDMFSCFRLASRMHELKESGYPFMKEILGIFAEESSQSLSILTM